MAGLAHENPSSDNVIGTLQHGGDDACNSGEHCAGIHDHVSTARVAVIAARVEVCLFAAVGVSRSASGGFSRSGVRILGSSTGGGGGGGSRYGRGGTGGDMGAVGLEGVLLARGSGVVFTASTGVAGKYSLRLDTETREVVDFAGGQSSSCCHEAAFEDWGTGADGGGLGRHGGSEEDSGKQFHFCDWFG